MHLLLIVLLLLASAAQAEEVRSEVILQADEGWDGSPWHYLPLPPRITLIRMHIPPNTTLGWHRHPMLNVGYVERGEITVERRADGLRHVVGEGQSIGELMNVPHRGHTGPDGAQLLIFYAGTAGLPLSIAEQ